MNMQMDKMFGTHYIKPWADTAYKGWLKSSEPNYFWQACKLHINGKYFWAFPQVIDIL